MESPRPSVVGRPRGAGVSVRVPFPVRQPDSWGEAARSFRRGADDLAQLARMGASLAAQEQAKEDQARFKDLYNRAMEETTRRLQQEVYTKKGSMRPIRFAPPIRSSPKFPASTPGS